MRHNRAGPLRTFNPRQSNAPGRRVPLRPCALAHLPAPPAAPAVCPAPTPWGTENTRTRATSHAACLRGWSWRTCTALSAPTSLQGP